VDSVVLSNITQAIVRAQENLDSALEALRAMEDRLGLRTAPTPQDVEERR
jgi:hypothetical protein